MKYESLNAQAEACDYRLSLKGIPMVSPMHPLLDAPVFRTDLYIPKYKPMEKENWRITHMGLGFDHGYFSDVWVVENMPILSRRSKSDPAQWETWMSICPHELESQELCCRYAYGHVAIMGLGMGWVVINTAMNPKVEKVTVVELDGEVIDIFRESGAMTDVPPEICKKIEIVRDDALTWNPGPERIDFLYADIWQKLVEAQTIEDVKKMQANMRAEKIYFWGQELFCIRDFRDSGLPDSAMNREFLVTYAKKLGLPILLPEDVDYPSLVLQAGRQRLKRRLPLAR